MIHLQVLNVEDNEQCLLNSPLDLVQHNKMCSELETIIKINDLHVETLLYGSCDANIDYINIYLK